MDIDETDREILKLLQEDARRPITEIADEVGLSSAAVHNRLDRLEEDDVIRGYRVFVDPAAVGLDAHAVIRLEFEQGSTAEARERLQELEGVQSIRLLAGKWDVAIRVYAPDIDALRDLMDEEIRTMDGFSRSEMDIVLETETRNHELPL